MHPSYVELQMAISPQWVIRFTSCLVLGWGFWVDGSNGAIFGSINPKMAIMTCHDRWSVEPLPNYFPPFRLGDPAVCGSRPLVTPH